MLRRAIAISVALAALSQGCDREAKRPPPVTVDAPSGQGTFVDGEGVRRPLFTTLGMLTYGQTVEGALPALNSLAGYEFLVEAGDAPRLDLADTGGEALLALYGPRSADGLWGQPVEVVQGAGALSLALDAVNQGGSWFVLVRDEAERARPYALTLTCEGCAAPACAPAPCDLVCANGFRVDGEGCRECACVPTAVCEPACDADARCVERVCQPLDCADRCDRDVAPVCGADRRTYPNRCIADCAEVQVVAEGACPEACMGPQDCPEGQQCLDGRCVVDTCGCDLSPAPVCSAGGETFRNACLLACAGAEPAYEGECVRRPCATAQDCGDGSVCVVAPVPGNAARCRANPEGADCVRECRDQRCRDDRECGPGAACMPVTPDFGRCVSRCRVGGNGCGAGTVCAAVDEDDRGDDGLCLTTCEPEGPPCDAPLVCASDALGQAVCQAAGCPPDDPDCEAGSACDECPEGWAPVCGEDGWLYANACRAECEGRSFDRAALCYRGRGELETACQVDADCAPTGCEGSVCAAARTDLCAALTPASRCYPATAACGCVEGQCGWRPTERTEGCLERASGGDFRP